jgi:uncharacterized membrane protein YeaQ/YmgE (transglycosylase-associated protein family)
MSKWEEGAMIGFLLMLLVAAIVGFIGDALVPGRMPGGWVGAIVAGLLGSAIGGYLFNALAVPMGPVLGGLALVPSIVGAAIVVFLFGAISSSLARADRY